MSSSASSNFIQIATNVVFCITATIFSVVTVWQGHRAWKMWRGNAHGQENVPPDIEFGLQSFRTPRTSLEVLDGHGAVASSAPSVDQVGEAAELDHMSVSVQRPELQPTLPMTVDAEISISPALVQGAPIDRNEPPRHPSGDAQCALTDIERRPAGDDHL